MERSSALKIHGAPRISVDFLATVQNHGNGRTAKGLTIHRGPPRKSPSVHGRPWKSAYLSMEQVRRPPWTSMHYGENQSLTTFARISSSVMAVCQILDKAFWTRLLSMAIKWDTEPPETKK